MRNQRSQPPSGVQILIPKPEKHHPKQISQPEKRGRGSGGPENRRACKLPRHAERRARARAHATAKTRELLQLEQQRRQHNGFRGELAAAKPRANFRKPSSFGFAGEGRSGAAPRRA